MVMPNCGCFDYLVIVPGSSPPWQAQQHPDDVLELRGDHLFDGRLVGPGPTVEISRGLVTLRATGRERAQLAAVSFELDTRLAALPAPGDAMRLIRTPSAGLGLSLTRNDRLLLAIGAITNLTLHPLSVRNVRSPIARRAWPSRDEMHVEFRVGDETRTLSGGEEGIIGGYGALVWNGWMDGAPGTDEHAAVYLLEEPIREAVIDSAELLSGEKLRMIKW
ncbi:MAG TPA: hypothetical protein VE422_45065 [Terriglobia bacterium]|nr:hypothetical protein [Terriglobia bacterium]